MKINLNTVDIDELDDAPKKEIIKKKPKTAVEGSTKKDNKRKENDDVLFRQ